MAIDRARSAVGTAGGQDLEKAAAKELTLQEKGESERFAADCKTRRKKPRAGVLEDAALAQGENWLLQNCARAGY